MINDESKQKKISIYQTVKIVKIILLHNLQLKIYLDVRHSNANHVLTSGMFVKFISYVLVVHVLQNAKNILLHFTSVPQLR